MENYKLYQSNLITDNQLAFIEQCKMASSEIKKQLNTTDTTWNFDKYNIFSLTSSSILFYNLYKELNIYIRDFVGDDRPLWIQSWLNFHEGEEVEKALHSHMHEWDYHGYIPIDPQHTTTVFHKGYEIQNKAGQIYLGLANGQENQRPDLTHYVRIDKPYNGTRITLGFDLATTPNKYIGNMKFFPLL